MTEKKTKAPKTTEELILKYVKSTSTGTAVVAIVLIITLLASCISPQPVIDRISAAKAKTYREFYQTTLLNDTIRDVATIRQAMKNYAGDDALCCGDETANLTNWFQIRGFLSNAVRDKAISQGNTATLQGVNPWGGDYSFAVEAALPYQFEVTVTNVDNEMLDALSRKLEDGAEKTEVSTGDGPGTITVTYLL